VKIWDVKTRKLLQTLEGGHTYWIHDLAYSPDDRLLASGSGDQSIKIWNVATGEEQETLKGHTEKVLSVAFSPDGSQLASTGDGALLRLWKLGSSQAAQNLPPACQRAW
jgi:WD40 repeat protein